jgi:hypothetical protein
MVIGPESGEKDRVESCSDAACAAGASRSATATTMTPLTADKLA